MRGKVLLSRGLDYFHEALADYLITNPGATLREIGAYFGYSPPWLSQVINTDMFQAYLAQRRVEINSAVAQGVPEKLRAAAHVAVERLAEVVATTGDEKLAVDAADKILARYGYGPGKTVGAQGPVIGTQNNVFLISSGDLAAGQASLIQAHGQNIQGGNRGEGGQVHLLPTSVDQTLEGERSDGSGGEV